jgi:hypothetical protein
LQPFAQADIASGPSEKSKPEPFKAIVVAGDEAGKGDDAGKEVDVVALRKDKPTIFVFIPDDKWARPMARYLKTLDDELAAKRTDVRIIAVWLTADVEKSKEYLPRADQSLKFKQTSLAVYPKEKTGPMNWGLNSDAHLTAVLVSDNVVDASFGYRSLNETDVPAVMKKLKPVAKK